MITVKPAVRMTDQELLDHVHLHHRTKKLNGLVRSTANLTPLVMESVRRYHDRKHPTGALHRTHKHVGPSKKRKETK